jgi:hypothetical protein
MNGDGVLAMALLDNAAQPDPTRTKELNGQSTV